MRLTVENKFWEVAISKFLKILLPVADFLGIIMKVDIPQFLVGWESKIAVG